MQVYQAEITVCGECKHVANVCCDDRKNPRALVNKGFRDAHDQGRKGSGGGKGQGAKRSNAAIGHVDASNAQWVVGNTDQLRLMVRENPLKTKVIPSC